MLSLEDTLKNCQQHAGRIRFIAIDSHGGSGKSSLASYLSQKLHAEIVHTDDFPTWDNPLNWWPLVIERIFEPITRGSTRLEYPRSNAWWDNDTPEVMIH